jgi:hypothetical protein
MSTKNVMNKKAPMMPAPALFFQAPFELVGEPRKVRLLSVLLRTLHEAEELAEVNFVVAVAAACVPEHARHFRVDFLVQQVGLEPPHQLGELRRVDRPAPVAVAGRKHRFARVEFVVVERAFELVRHRVLALPLLEQLVRPQRRRLGAQLDEQVRHQEGAAERNGAHASRHHGVAVVKPV